MLRCTICCRCFGLEVVPISKMYDLLPLLWSRSGAPKLRCTICCRCFGAPVLRCTICWLLWPRSGAPMLRCTICCRCLGREVVPQFQELRFVAVALVSKWCPNAKMCDLLPLLWPRSGAPMLRCAICCRCFGLEVVPQFQNERFVAVALASRWCPNAKMYDLLPLLWSRSGAPIQRCTICCRCFGLEVVPPF